MKSIKVTQSASDKFAPDSTVIHVWLRAESKKYAEAIQLLEKKRAELLASLPPLGDEISLRGASVGSVRRDGKTLFCASTELKIALPVTDERIGDAIAALEKCGAEWNQEFALGDTAYKDTLIRRAVSAARSVAESIAAAAGVNLGDVISVEYESGFGGGARVMRAMAARDEIVASPEPIEASENVTCEWEIVG